MKKTFILLLQVLFFNSILLAQQTWSQVASISKLGRNVAISFTLNGKAYAGLGENKSGTRLNDFWEFNPATNSWTQKADYPGGGKYAATAFIANGKAFVGLGESSSAISQKDLWEYIPSTDKWVRKTDFPGAARYGSSCFVIGDTAFVGTGSSGSPPYLSDMWMYVASTDAWTKKANFPGGARTGGIAFTIAKNGFMGTGFQNSTTVLSDIWRYNKSTDTWTAMSNYGGSGIMGAVSFVLKNKGYVGTGYNLTSRVKDFYEYDVSANSWTKLDSIPSSFGARHSATAFAINDIGYIGTGQLTSNLTTIDFWSYNPYHLAAIKDYKNETSSFKCFPNPVVNILYVELPVKDEQNEVSLYTLDGQLIMHQKAINGKLEIDFTNLSKGVYFLKSMTINNLTVRKILKE